MKKRIMTCSIMIFFIVFMLGFYLVSCGKNEKTTNDEERDKYSEQFFKTISKPNQEAVALLSQKYDLQPNVIENFLDKYLSDTDMGYRLIKSALKSSTTNASNSDDKEMIGLEYGKYLITLEKEAQAFGISTKTAALIVLDYKMLVSKGNNSE